MKKIAFLSVISGAILMTGCVNNSTTNDIAKDMESNKETKIAEASGVPVDITFSGVRFTKSINGADSLITIHPDGKMEFRAGEKQDYFCDPNEELSNNTAPILLSKVDNTKPFTLIAKVTPEFTKTGTYNAAVLYLYVNDTFWQKLCFEQDERGGHRIVTVRTVDTSDDNNHDIVEQPYVYMKISSDTRTIGSYYSTDKKTWRMVRIYKNNYPSELWVGISNQCPVDKASVSYFEDISLDQENVSDFRMGN